MRLIKFRAWNRERKVMGSAIPLDVLLLQAADDPTGPREELKNLDVMQWTGLRDKHGREIYEGDIVCFVDDVVVENIGGWDRTEAEGKFREVKWNQLHCAYGLFNNDGQSEDMLADWINDDGSVPTRWECKELEVIGNRFEHPELIHTAE